MLEDIKYDFTKWFCYSGLKSISNFTRETKKITQYRIFKLIVYPFDFCFFSSKFFECLDIFILAFVPVIIPTN